MTLLVDLLHAVAHRRLSAIGREAERRPHPQLHHKKENAMKKILFSLAALSTLSALAGCATTDATGREDTVVASREEAEYITGSNIPRRRSAADNVSNLSAEQLDEMRRNMQNRPMQPVTGK
jgi:hypothetical protein